MNFRSVLAGLCAVAVGGFANFGTARADTPKPVPLQILAINDFHGHLEPPNGASGRVDGVLAGGAEYLAAHLDRARHGQKHTIMVSAGDDIGGSPLISGLFHDEPTLEAFDLMKVEISAVGNHEFDQGPVELLRLAHGGCPATGACPKKPWKGIKMTYLGANVRDTTTGKPLFPPSTIRTYGGVAVAFIGLTLKETPSIVIKKGTAGLTFSDEADAINQEVARLKANPGVHAFVVLLHQGDTVRGGDVNSCNGLSGPLAGIVARLDKDVDLVLSAHSHQNYVCQIAGKPVSQSGSFGTVFADIRTTLDPGRRDFSSIVITNNIVTRDINPSGKMTKLVDKWRQQSALLGRDFVGRIAIDVTRTPNAVGESALGDLVADAQLAAAKTAVSDLPRLAITNPGGLRADLSLVGARAARPVGELTYGEVFATQPFQNPLVTVTITGADLKAAFEQQFDNPATGKVRILQVSGNVKERVDPKQAVGARVLSLTVDNQEIVAASRYRLTMNGFLEGGGDAFTALTKGTDRAEQGTDLGALVDYLRGLTGAYNPPPLNRVTVA